MHLSANSIGHPLKETKGSDVYVLTTFYDEFLSHYLWHFGLVGLSALLIYRQWQHPFVGERSGLGLESLAGFVRGFNYFVTVVEARAAPLGVPCDSGNGIGSRVGTKEAKAAAFTCLLLRSLLGGHDSLRSVGSLLG